jgi:large repetitive protein
MRAKTLVMKLFAVLAIASLVFLVGCGGTTAQSINQRDGAGDGAHQFASTGNLVVSQILHSTTLLADGRVLIACGTTGAVVPTGEAELFDPVSGTFRSFSATPRRFCTATLLPNGKVLIAGGSADQTARNSAELFDPATGLFQPTGNMTSARSGHSATLLSDGRVLITGGVDQTAEIYDPAAGTFVPTGNMFTARSGQTATMLSDGKVLVAGGDALGTAELYDSSSGMFSPTGSLMIPRSGHTATLLPNGKVFFAGGAGPTNDNEFAPIDPRTELYDPATSQSSNAGNMTVPRMWQTATLLADGTVLLVGGYVGGFHTTTSAEIYDPATSIFTATAGLAQSRAYHSATRLADGSVLVTGGQHAEPGPPAALSTAEIYK